MPRKRKPPRLYLATNNKNPVWVIRYGNIFKSTGYSEVEKELAETALKEFVRDGQHLGPFEKKTLTTGTVYFISSMNSETYPIKIGFTTEDILKRLASLQIGNPNRLTCLGTIPGTMELEQKIHEQFSDAKIHSEWFTRNPRLMDFILQQTTKSLVVYQ